MKKKICTLSILGFLLIIGAIVFFIICGLPDKNDKSQNNSLSKSSVSLINQDETSISSLFISNSSSKFNINVSCGEDGSVTYSIPELDKDQKISEPDAKSAIKKISQLKATEKVLESCENLSDYGLDSPTAAITVNLVDGSKVELSLGKAAPLNKGYYLKIDKDDSIYLISAGDASVFNLSKTNYIEQSENSD